jgi:hypothetical protein
MLSGGRGGVVADPGTGWTPEDLDPDELVAFTGREAVTLFEDIALALCLATLNPLTCVWAFSSLTSPGPLFWISWGGWIVVGMIWRRRYVQKRGKRLIVTNRRVLWGNDIFERERMQNVRYFYDGGIEQAVKRPCVEFEYGGGTVRRTIALKDSLTALDAILGKPHGSVGLTGGATRKRSAGTAGSER